MKNKKLINFNYSFGSHLRRIPSKLRRIPKNASFIISSSSAHFKHIYLSLKEQYLFEYYFVL